MVSVKNFHRSARARPPPADTPDESSAVTTSQVTPSIHDFAVSLAPDGSPLVRTQLRPPDFQLISTRRSSPGLTARWASWSIASGWMSWSVPLSHSHVGGYPLW